jgi:hypothetical protein
MKKLYLQTTILSILCLIAFQHGVIAQPGKKNSINLSAGGDFLLPEADGFRLTHPAGGGVSVKGEYVFARHTSVTLSSGYYVVAGRKTSSTTPGYANLNVLPLRLGLRYYLGNFYIGGEGGVARFSGFEKGTGLVYSFMIGDELVSRRNGNSLDLSIRHEAWRIDKTRAVVGLRLAYEFRLR